MAPGELINNLQGRIPSSYHSDIETKLEKGNEPFVFFENKRSLREKMFVHVLCVFSSPVTNW